MITNNRLVLYFFNIFYFLMMDEKLLNSNSSDLSLVINYENLDSNSDQSERLQVTFEPSQPITAEYPTKELFNGVEISKLTKRQKKKYKKFLNWQNVKKDKRAKEKEKIKEKRKYAKLNNIEVGPSRKELKRRKMEASPCKIAVCIDLSFDNLMIDKDMAKTIKQILRVYTENRRSPAPMQLHLSSFNGRSKEEMERHNGYQHWDMHFHENHYLDVFPKDKLVYLTSDSDTVIQKLEDDKVYIIGGLVDHNAHKGICYNKAVEEGIAHGQLPIGEYFWMKQRKVLTINQVFEILIRVSEGKTFKEAFELILPRRKEIVSLASPPGKNIEMKNEDLGDSLEEKVVSIATSYEETMEGTSYEEKTEVSNEYLVHVSEDRMLMNCNDLATSSEERVEVNSDDSEDPYKEKMEVISQDLTSVSQEKNSEDLASFTTERVEVINDVLANFSEERVEVNSEKLANPLKEKLEDLISSSEVKTKGDNKDLATSKGNMEAKHEDLTRLSEERTKNIENLANTYQER